MQINNKGTFVIGIVLTIVGIVFLIIGIVTLSTFTEGDTRSMTFYIGIAAGGAITAGRSIISVLQETGKI